MTEFELAAAIAYMENRSGLASRDNYLHFDKAMNIIIQAAQNLLDIAQDPETRNVPVDPLNEMVHAGMDAYDQSFGAGPFTGAKAVFAAMVRNCPRDERLPTPVPPFPTQNDPLNPPF